jgi:hypothetical protein
MSGGNINVENIKLWKTMTSIDYITYFVKGWIAFNAWYKNYYPSLDTDRLIINEIKNSNNKVKNKLISLIDGSDSESLRIKTHIADLHSQLEQYHIYQTYKKQPIRITFTNFVIEDNQNTNSEFTARGFKYRCTRIQKDIELEISDQNGNIKFTHRQVASYDFSEIEALQDYKSLTDIRKSNLKVCYKEIDPRKPENLLTRDAQKAIEIGNFHFTEDIEKIAKAIIEMLYLLRNALFHGELIPDHNAQRVYEPAYHILKTLVESL